jgi:hypothetical protein
VQVKGRGQSVEVHTLENGSRRDYH